MEEGRDLHEIWPSSGNQMEVRSRHLEIDFQVRGDSITGGGESLISSTALTGISYQSHRWQVGVP